MNHRGQIWTSLAEEKIKKYLKICQYDSQFRCIFHKQRGIVVKITAVSSKGSNGGSMLIFLNYCFPSCPSMNPKRERWKECVRKLKKGND